MSGTDARQQEDLTWVGGLVAQAQTRQFYGKLVIIMEGGEVIRAVKEESLKPPRTERLGKTGDRPRGMGR